jgi:hypothetical protein
MPAALPGETSTPTGVNPTGNPSAGLLVTFDAMSGPKNSPFDAAKIDYTTGSPPGWNATTRIPIKVNDPVNISTGALATGIGFGSPPIIGLTAPQSIKDASFTDDYSPGRAKTDASATTDSTYMYVGGGKSLANGTSAPYTAGYGIAAAGNTSTRDQGAGPAYTGKPMKTVTAVGAVANAAVVETDWSNYSGLALVAGQSVFGLGAALPAPADAEEEPEEEEPIP